MNSAFHKACNAYTLWQTKCSRESSKRNVGVKECSGGGGLAVVNRATAGGRERESVCVYVSRGFQASRLQWGVRARFVTGVRLDAAGTQTECGRKGRSDLAIPALGQAARVIYMCTPCEAVF